MRVFLNPGHAKKGDPGACGYGLQENIVALNIGEKVYALLKSKGVDVQLYQAPVENYPYNDTLAEICEESNHWQADIFISIHCNAAANSSANGTETFYNANSANGAKLANAIHNKILNYIPELTDRGTKNTPLYVTKHTDAVAVLVETAFISNAKDAEILREKQDDFANAIVDGICEYARIGSNALVNEKSSISKENSSQICPTVGQIAVLTRKYESNGDPACVSSGIGDVGGISYGLYQLASNVGAVDEFVSWLCDYPDNKFANYGRVLQKYQVNSQQFIQQWKELGTVDPVNFGRLQDEYIKVKYYDAASDKLRKNYYDVEKHSDALKAVVLSRAVQNGVSGCAKLFEIAVARLNQPNLSYVDDKYFDEEIITAIYDFLTEECDRVQNVGGLWKSPNNFCKGSAGVIQGLKRRFENEKSDALLLLRDQNIDF